MSHKLELSRYWQPEKCVTFHITAIIMSFVTISEKLLVMVKERLEQVLETGVERPPIGIQALPVDVGLSCVHRAVQ